MTTPHGTRMHTTALVAGLGLGLAIAASCGGDDQGRMTGSASGLPPVGTAGDGTATHAGTVDDGTADGPTFDLGTTPDADSVDDCVPPDVLVVLDRSQSMHRTPAGDTPPNDMAGYESSRWWIALAALDTLWLEYDAGLALGLELFPAVAGGCVTLAERIGGTSASNDGCGTSELAFAPQVGTAGAFDAALDPLATLLCNQTPIAAAIGDAIGVLQGLAAPDHEQHVILLTDGGESCDGDFTGQVQQLVASTGARVHVVAFGDTALTSAHDGLNRMACAGQTAAGFPAPCVDDGMGNFDAADPGGAALYIPAEDGQALVSAFDGLATELCCGASCPVG